MKPRTSLGVWRWIHSLNLVILLSLTIHHPRVRWPDMWNETWRHFPEYSLRTWDIQYLFLGTWCHMDIYADTISVCYCGNERLYSHEGWNEKGHLLTLNLFDVRAITHVSGGGEAPEKTKTSGGLCSNLLLHEQQRQRKKGKGSCWQIHWRHCKKQQRSTSTPYW